MGQVKGENGLKWYSWNASGGFMMPIDPFHTRLSGGAGHHYQFSGTPGFTYSLGKPFGLQVVAGAELEDHRIDGTVRNYQSIGNERLYNARLRTYSLFGQYYVSPIWNLNPFIMLKFGYTGINRARGNKDLSRTLPADRWDIVFTAATGVTWHADPNFSVNLYGEFSPISNKYLRELFGDLEAKTLPMTRVVLTLTAHTDIRVFYPFYRGRGFTTRFKPDPYLPFVSERIRKNKGKR